MSHIKQKRKNILYVLLSLLLVIGVVAGLELSNKTHLFHKSQVASKTDDINYGPPTKVEKQDSESHKDTAPPSTTNKSTDTDNIHKKTVTPEITTYKQNKDTSAFTVNSLVPDIVETGGTCTLTMTLSTDASQKVTASHQGEANVINTTCGELSIPLKKLHSGTWNTTISYSSATSSGISDVNPLEVQ